MNINMEDRENYIAFLQGDMQGFERLVIKYKDHLIYFLQTYVKNITVAEDLAQDVFVDVLIYKERFQLEKQFKTYLFTIGKHKAIDFLRKQRYFTSMEEIEWLEDCQQLEEVLFQKENNTLLLTALHQLKREYRQIITLIDLEEMSYREAGIILDKTVPQIKILIYRARKSLKKQLIKVGYCYEEQ